MRLDRAAQAAPGHKIAADRGFLMVEIRGRPTCLACATTHPIPKTPRDDSLSIRRNPYAETAVKGIPNSFI
jgi:hypothetical protein